MVLTHVPITITKISRYKGFAIRSLEHHSLLQQGKHEQERLEVQPSQGGESDMEFPSDNIQISVLEEGPILKKTTKQFPSVIDDFLKLYGIGDHSIRLIFNLGSRPIDENEGWRSYRHKRKQEEKKRRRKKPPNRARAAAGPRPESARPDAIRGRPAVRPRQRQDSEVHCFADLLPRGPGAFPRRPREGRACLDAADSRQQPP